MKTSKPFGFISYNSREFLKNVLETFITDAKFLRCACWYHESTGKEKNHYHVWVEPNTEIDTSTISDKFVETLENGEQQSIAIRPKCSSKWNDAYLYGIHDYEYLQSKGLERELVNIKTDMHIYLGDFTAEIKQAEIYRLKHCLAPYARLKALVYEGLKLEEVFITLRIPFSQLNAVSTAYYNLQLQKDNERQEAAEQRTAQMAAERDLIKNTSPVDIPPDNIPDEDED